MKNWNQERQNEARAKALFIGGVGLGNRLGLIGFNMCWMGLMVAAFHIKGIGSDLESSGAKRPNILFIAMDDLNDWVGCLGGHPQTLTPNLDRLASESVLFDNAHCPGTACNASRTAIMTGLAPNQSGLYSNRQRMREILPDRSGRAKSATDTAWRGLGDSRCEYRRLSGKLSCRGPALESHHAKRWGVVTNATQCFKNCDIEGLVVPVGTRQSFHVQGRVSLDNLEINP